MLLLLLFYIDTNTDQYEMESALHDLTVGRCGVTGVFLILYLLYEINLSLTNELL